jgi:hypothetical protein
MWFGISERVWLIDEEQSLCRLLCVYYLIKHTSNKNDEAARGGIERVSEVTHWQDPLMVRQPCLPRQIFGLNSLSWYSFPSNSLP